MVSEASRHGSRPRRPIRVGYVSGPSDADRIYEDLKSDSPPSYFGTNYMRQFLLLMEEIGAEALIETWHGDESYRRTIGNFTFNNVALRQSRSLGHHLRDFFHLLGILWRFLLLRPDIVVLTGKQEYWWVLAPLRLTRTRFVASFHGMIWAPFQPLKGHAALLRALNQHLILRRLAAAVSTSHRISNQLRELEGSKRVPLFEHLPSWKAEQFKGIVPAGELEPSPFNIMFMGRIERDKGVYDLLEVAATLARQRPGEFEFHFCGDGAELSSLRRSVEERGLDTTVHLHGYCGPDDMRRVMSLCHAVVVPTRSECPAGFEMTCAEAVLSGRPLVTSAVAPALDYLRPASVEVPPDDVDAYREAIVELKDDPVIYQAKREACAKLRGQFFDYEKSWDHAMRLAFAALPVRSR